LFPLIEGNDFDRLVEDVRQNGVVEPIILYEGAILDGRNRYRAALAADARCPLVQFDGEDPLAFVLSKNLHRRHLNESQRAMIAAKIATLKDGQQQVGKFADVPTQAEAAKALHVSERSVRDAAAVRDHGALELREAVERGEIRVSEAAQIARVKEDEQRALVAKPKRERKKITAEHKRLAQQARPSKFRRAIIRALTCVAGFSPDHWRGFFAEMPEDAHAIYLAWRAECEPTPAHSGMHD
jgi:hypothetical protein